MYQLRPQVIADYHMDCGSCITPQQTEAVQAVTNPMLQEDLFLSMMDYTLLPEIAASVKDLD